MQYMKSYIISMTVHLWKLLYVRKNINLCTKNSDNHKTNTRNKDKLAVPTIRLHIVRKSFTGQCVGFYNNISSDVVKLSANKLKTLVNINLIKKRRYHTISDYLEDKKACD